MGREVENRDVALPRAANAQNADRFVEVADGFGDVGIVHAGIGADGSVLHAVTAQEGDALRFREPDRQGRGDQVVDGQAGGVREPRRQKLVVEVRPVEEVRAPLVGLAGARPRVRVRAVHVDRVVPHARSLRDAPTQGRVERDALDSEEIGGDHHRRVVSVGERDGIGLQVVEDALRMPFLEVSDDRRAQRRRDIHPREAGLERTVTH